MGGGFAGFAETVALTGSKEAYASGTSGSPILTENGRAVGVMSVGDILNPVLLTALLPRVIGMAHAARTNE
jgi:Peptidase S7, Flavivirus NS3 serine protease